MEILEEIKEILASTAKGASVYYSVDMPMFYCTIEEYEKNRQKIKMHYPVIHRYYNMGWCVNTDGIGKPLTAKNLSYFDIAPCEYPEELVKKVDFPLYLGAGECWNIERSGFWRNGFGSFIYEKFILSFSLTRKTMHFYRVLVRINDEERIEFRAYQFLLPPCPVVITNRIWEGEEDGAYTIEDLKEDLKAAVMKFKPSFSAVEIQAGVDKAFKERREKIISLVDKKIK